MRDALSPINGDLSTMITVTSKSLVLLALFALTTSVYAAPQWYLTAGAGFEVPNISSSTTVNNNSLANPPYDVDIYSSVNHGNAALLLEAGQQWTIGKTGMNSLALGLQYQYFLPTNVGRQVMQNSSPDFLNYRYRLNLEANMLLLNAKIELCSWKNFSPFIDVGVGGVQLIAKSYHENAYSGVTARISPAYQDHTSYQFAYQVGAGINWKLKPTLIASISYLYHSFGNFTTNYGTGDWSNSKLDFGHASAQAAYLTMTYMV